MIEDKSDPDLPPELAQALKSEAQQVAQPVAGRLRDARVEAVRQIDQPAPISINWLRGGLVATAAMMILVVMVTTRSPEPIPRLPLVGEQEAALVTDMELLEQLEFLAWLEEESPNAG